MDEREFLVRSLAVFTGLNHRPEPATIYVQGKQIKEMLPWEIEEAYQHLPLYDYGSQMIMPSFLDAHTHIFSGAVNYSDYVCDDLTECASE